jgi:hypothetical protein
MFTTSADRQVHRKYKQGYVEISDKPAVMARLFWDENPILLSPFTTFIENWTYTQQFMYKVDECEFGSNSKLFSL